MFRIDRNYETVEEGTYRKKIPNKQKLRRLKEKLIKYQGFRCAICGEVVFNRDIGGDNDITVEHVNGHGYNDETANVWVNLVIACRKCNQYRSRFQSGKSEVVNFIDESGGLFFENTYYDVFTGRIEILDECNDPQLFDQISNTIQHYGLNREYMIANREEFIESISDENQLNRVLNLIKNNELDSIEIYSPYLLMKDKISIIGKDIFLEGYQEIMLKYKRRY